MSRATKGLFHWKQLGVGQRLSHFIGNNVVAGGWGNKRVVSWETTVGEGKDQVVSLEMT